MKHIFKIFIMLSVVTFIIALQIVSKKQINTFKSDYKIQLISNDSINIYSIVNDTIYSTNSDSVVYYMNKDKLWKRFH